MAKKNTEIESINRIGTRPIRNHEQAVFEMEALVHGIDAERSRMEENKDTSWWRLQDLLDDAIDLLDWIKSPAITDDSHKNVNNKNK
jgi:hypothetical protein